MQQDPTGELARGLPHVVADASPADQPSIEVQRAMGLRDDPSATWIVVEATWLYTVARFQLRLVGASEPKVDALFVWMDVTND